MVSNVSWFDDMYNLEAWSNNASPSRIVGTKIISIKAIVKIAAETVSGIFFLIILCNGNTIYTTTKLSIITEINGLITRNER